MKTKTKTWKHEEVPELLVMETLEPTHTHTHRHTHTNEKNEMKRHMWTLGLR